MIYLLKRKISIFIISFLERRAKRKLKAEGDVWEFLSKVVSGSTGCSYNDYWVLYSHIKKHKPKEILEFGSGISTVVMGYAIKKNGTGRLMSMEESSEYADSTRVLLPEDMRSFIEVVYSPSVEKRFGPFAGRGYKQIPERQYEFVFVDGPHYDRETSFDVDLLEIVAKSHIPVFGVVDSRGGSSVIYNLYLKPKFYFDYFQNIGYLDGATKKDLATYHQVISREFREHSVKRTLML